MIHVSGLLFPQNDFVNGELHIILKPIDLVLLLAIIIAISAALKILVR